MDLKVASRKLSPFSVSHTHSTSTSLRPCSASDVRPAKTEKCEFYRLLLAWTDCQLNSSFSENRKFAPDKDTSVLYHARACVWEHDESLAGAIEEDKNNNKIDVEA